MPPDGITLTDKFVKVGLGVTKLVLGESRLDAISEIMEVVTNGRDLLADLRPDEEDIGRRLRAASGAQLNSHDVASEYPEEVLHDARAQMDEALDHRIPDAAALARLDLDPERITDAMIEAAPARAPRADFAIAWAQPGSPSRRYFRTVCVGFFGDLLSDDEVIQKLAPVLWGDLLRTVHGMDRKLDLLVERGEAKAGEAGGLLRVAIIQLAKRIARDVPDVEQAMIELDRAVGIAVEVQEAGRHASNLGAFVDEVLVRMAALSAEGRFFDAPSQAHLSISARMSSTRHAVMRGPSLTGRG